MSVIWFSVQGSFGGGGPSVWVAKTAQALMKRGHKVIFDKPQRADVAICVINVGKTLRRVNRDKTKVILRTDGIYNAEYNKLFNRPMTPDAIALHKDLEKNIPLVDWCVWQSLWSKDRCDEEIVKRQDKNWSIIHNGVDTNLFKPTPRKNDGTIKLFHIGKMRNGYIMESLLGTLDELRNRSHNVELLFAGSMDAECKKVWASHNKKYATYLGACSNNQAPQLFGQGDIYLGPRMGSSCDNVIVEALSCGLPPVIPSWGGNAELITSGLEGIVVPSGQWDYGESYVKNLANAVEKIIPDLNGFKLRARQHAVKELTIEKMVDKYLKAMEL